MKLFRKKKEETPKTDKREWVDPEKGIVRIDETDDCFKRALKILEVARIADGNGLSCKLARGIKAYQDLDEFNRNEVKDVRVVRASSLKNGQYFHNGDGKFSPISNLKIDNSQVSLTDATGESFLFYPNELVIIDTFRESK